MSIAKTTRPHLLTREAAAARIEALEAALDKMAADSDVELTQLTHAVADNIRKIEALEAALREIAGSAAVAASVRDFARAALAEGQDK